MGLTSRNGTITVPCGGCVGQVAVGVNRPLDHSFDAEALPHPFARGGTEPSPSVRFLKQLHNRRGESIGITRRHEYACAPIDNDFGNPAGTRRHGCLSHSHGVQQCRAHAFRDRTHHKEIGVQGGDPQPVA